MLRAWTRRGRTAFISALLIIAVGQVGRMPVPASYQMYGDEVLHRIAARSRSQGRRADVIIMGDSRIICAIDPRGLASNLRIGHRSDAAPAVEMLAAFGMTPSAQYWLWRAIAAQGCHPRARLAIIELWELGMNWQGAARDWNLRYLYGARDAVWLLRHGRLNEAATLLTYSYVSPLREARLGAQRNRKKTGSPRPSRRRSCTACAQGQVQSSQAALVPVPVLRLQD